MRPVATVLHRAPGVPLIPPDELYTLAVRQCRYALERAQARFGYWVDLVPASDRQREEQEEALAEATRVIGAHQARLKELLSKTSLSSYTDTVQGVLI